MYPYEVQVRNERTIKILTIAVIIILLLCGWALMLTPCPADIFC